MLKLDPSRTAAPPKDAATVLWVRDGEGGLEIFCVRRHAQSAFMGGAVVFPGGKLDPADVSAAERAGGVHPRALAFADDPAHALALAVCACRESLEEAGLFPCIPQLEADRLQALREGLAGGADFNALLRREGLELDTATLVPFARWITPIAEQRRYDARFFLSRAPAGQRGRHDDHETVSSLWAGPAELLGAFARGDLFLAPPTLRALELLEPLADVDAAVALCAAQTLLPICPRFVPRDPPMLVLPGDPEHELDERRVAGPTRFVLRDGKFISEEASRCRT